MVKRIFLLFILATACCRGNTQGGLDSLLEVAETAVDDSVKLDAMKHAYMMFIFRDPEKCIRYARESVFLAHELEAHEFEAHALLAISQVYQLLDYQQLGIQYSMEARRICEDHGLKESLADVYNSLGAIEYKQKQPDSALTYFQLSLDIRRGFSSDLNIAASLNNIGLIKTEMKAYEEAKQYLEESYAMYDSMDILRGAVITLGNLGDVSREMKAYDLAKEYYAKAIEMAQNPLVVDVLPVIKFELAKTLLEAGDKVEARKEFERLESEGQLPTSSMEELHEKMSDLAQEEGDLQTALDHLGLLKSLQDSMRKARNSEQIASARMFNRISLEEQEFEFNNRQAALSQSEENKRDRLISWLYIMGISFSLILAGILFYRVREQRKLSRRLSHEIEGQTVELKRANSELNTFIYRSSHDLRGPINTIQGLQGLLDSGAVPKEKVAEMLGRKVGQLEKGQRHLVQSMEFRNRVPELEIVNVLEIVKNIVERLQGIHEKCLVDIRVDIPVTSLFLTDHWVMSQVLEYLLDNAIIFRNQKIGSWCNITMHQDEKKMEIQVEDNGIGMPIEVVLQAKDMFFRGSNASRGNGLGLYNAALGIELLQGEMVLQSRDGEGTMVKLTLPVLDSI